MGNLEILKPAGSPGSTIREYDNLLTQMKAAQLARRTRYNRNARLDHLERLREAVLAHEAQIIEACERDFRKPAAEVKLTELFPVLQEIRHAKRHLRQWMNPRRAAMTLSMAGTRARVRPEAKGVCLIIAPWNYPVNLSLGPLVSAIAAGNSVVIKPSELTPHTSAIIADIVGEVFSPSHVAVVQGGVETARSLLEQPFDHIFFTGSPAVGKIVMAAAGRNLSSVTLELGGKSPTIVGPGADMRKAVQSIVWGKFANNGQTCIAPDHVYVHSSISQKFEQAVIAEIRRVYGSDSRELKANPDYCRIVNARHFERLHALIKDARAKGGEIAFGGEFDSSEHYISPTVLRGMNPDMDIAEEELFGPLLPLIPFDNLDDVIGRINSQPKPLALYIFEKDRSSIDRVIANTSTGGIGINVTVAQFLHPNLPFGGVNNSGIGAAHGEYGFRSFSHERAILEDRFSILSWLYPPYTPRVRRLINLIVRVLG